MGWKSSLAIKFHLGFWFYLVGGGAVYYYIEDPLYHLPPQPKPMTINDTFCQYLVYSVENYMTNIVRVPLEPNDSTVRNKLMRDSCIKLINVEENENQDVAWEFSSALFLCMTILTTIGYGCFSPISNWGKVFCIFYGLIGIPICGILLANTSDYFSNGFMRLYKQRRSKQQRDKWHGIFIATNIFLLPGLVVFLFIPAAIFTYLEDWSYLDATYFSFVTLTTIGFGDIIAAQETNYPQLWFYRICWIVWVMLGIAYWFTIISFITKALRSKRLREKWAKTSYAISIQAKEMRRIAKQLSTNDLNGNFAFTALKSKIAFDFSSKLSTLMGSVRAARKRQPPPDELSPSIKLADRPGRGSLALMELSVPTLDHKKEQRKQSVNPPAVPVAVLAEEEVHISPQINILTRHQTLINCQSSSSMDSGFDDDKIITSESYSTPTPCDSEEKTKKTERKCSRSSCGQTQLELQHETSSTERQADLRKLLMAALLLLEEPEPKGTIASQSAMKLE